MGLMRFLVFAIIGYVALQFFKDLLGKIPAPPRQPHARPPRPSGSPSPEEVLGVASNATFEEVRAAYQKLMQQYHPDRVADLGPELRELAEKKAKEINAAYDELKRKYT